MVTKTLASALDDLRQNPPIKQNPSVAKNEGRIAEKAAAISPVRSLYFSVEIRNCQGFWKWTMALYTEGTPKDSELSTANAG